MIRAALCAAALAVTLATAAAADEPRRVAVLVGANQGAGGRPDLRYSYSDARSMGDTLVQVGGFAAADVHVMLDPEPDAVLFTLDRELAALRGQPGETLLLFYYSGHADGQALYPAGRPLPYQQLRARLEDRSATVRVGIVDACGGGGWTGAKGLQASPPFEVNVPLTLAGEGSALISSSSGLESAHETEGLLGSFFTHHLVAALRGAADTRGDGVVTLTEAFAYARERTVRDTAALGGEPQHPSFDLRLRGRTDLPLARVARTGTRLEVKQRRGPLQIIQLSSGLMVAEVPAGLRQVGLAVPPGRYLVRGASGQGIMARETVVESGQSTVFSEESLLPSGAPALVAKRFVEAAAGTLTTPVALSCVVSLRAGVVYGESLESGLFNRANDGPKAFLDGPVCGLTDRLAAAVLVLLYRFGERGKVELIPRAGFDSFGTDGSYRVQAGFDARVWASFYDSLDFTSTVLSVGEFNANPALRRRLDTWYAQIGAGYTHNFYDLVTVHLGATWGQYVLKDGHHALWSDQQGGSAALTLGSDQTSAGQPLPLVRVFLAPWLSLDGSAYAAIDLRTAAVKTTYLAGFTATFR